MRVITFIAQIAGNKALLTAEESWHCAKVLRKRPGEAVHLIDGKGNFYEGELELVTDKQCTARVLQGPIPQAARAYYLHLAVAPTKQIDRMEWLIEKAVEIGVDEISFFHSRNSERTVVKMERVERIVESAVKQSLQARLPALNALRPLSALLDAGAEQQRFIAHCFDLPKVAIRSAGFTDKRTLVLIGPEGDFTRGEVEAAQEKGFAGLDLGVNRLRTETAGLFVCQAAALLA